MPTTTTRRRAAAEAATTDAGIEDAEFTVANSANVENVLKETFQGEEMTERKRSYARDHLLNSFVNASTSEKAKGSSSGGESDASASSDEAMWYTIECSEMRENAAMANCLNVSGVVDVWCPRKPPPGFVLAEEETHGRTDLEIRQLIVEGEPIQAGFILAKIANMSQDTIRSLESEYFVQGLATGGTTSFGKRQATRREIAEPIDPGLFESLIRASAPTIVSRVEYDAKIKELMSEMDLSKREEEETNIYGVKMKKRTERVAELRAENPTEEEEEKKAKKKTYDLEIFNGPFKGFHGNVVERLEDGVVRAEVVIFGKTNTVTLESSEYRETSKPPSK
jgi:transcription antitermination factor NusG